MLHRFMSGILATTLAFGMYIPTIMSISAKEQIEEIKKE